MRLFASTFAVVLFSFLVIATIISPNLNIPALNDDKESVQDNMGSSDFKSRVDYRLQEIESDDTTPKTMSGRVPQQQEGNQLQQAMQTANSLVKVNLPTFNSPQLPTRNYNNAPVAPNFGNSRQQRKSNQYQQYPQQQYANQYPQQQRYAQQQYPNQYPQQQRPAAQQKKTAYQQPTPYIPRSQQQKGTKSYKVLVGSYSTPEDAQRAAEAMPANPQAKPFIKSHNGSYAVQVGSYNDSQKAQSMAGSYKAKSYKTKVIDN